MCFEAEVLGRAHDSGCIWGRIWGPRLAAGPRLLHPQPPPPSGALSTSATPAGVPAVATPLIQDPHASVHFMKPLQTLVGAYSPFALRHMQDKCQRSVEDLQARARDRDAYESGARGLPLQASPWSVKRRDVVDADTGISS